MNIVYHNLSDTQFEELVIELCVELLGHAVQEFVSGKDGGRDARFIRVHWEETEIQNQRSDGENVWLHRPDSF